MVCRVLLFSHNLKIWIWLWKLKKKIAILLAFFPYLAQIIISTRGCVACNDLWPWPIFSRSFSLDLENCVRSVASAVLDGLFPYLVQMITSMRCVACDYLLPLPISSRSFDLDLIWDPTCLNSMGNHEAAGVSSERRRSSCSSLACHRETCFTKKVLAAKHELKTSMYVIQYNCYPAIYAGNGFVWSWNGRDTTDVIRDFI